MRGTAAAGALLLLAAAPTAEPPPNPQVVGERAFLKCYSCHTIRTEAVLSGPSLRGIIGRKTAAQPEFNYSPAMRAFAVSNPVWTLDLLDRYAADPHRVVPGTTMTFPGVPDPEERAELMAYLLSAGGQQP